MRSLLGSLRSWFTEVLPDGVSSVAEASANAGAHVWCLAHHADRLYAGDATGAVQVWQCDPAGAVTGHVAALCGDHDQTVYALLVGADVLISADATGQLTAWKITDPPELLCVAGTTPAMPVLALAGDVHGAFFSASADGRVRRWVFDSMQHSLSCTHSTDSSGKTLYALKLLLANPQCVAVSGGVVADGAWAVAAVGIDAMVRVWLAANLALVGCIDCRASVSRWPPPPSSHASSASESGGGGAGSPDAESAPLSLFCIAAVETAKAKPAPARPATTPTCAGAEAAAEAAEAEAAAEAAEAEAKAEAEAEAAAGREICLLVGGTDCVVRLVAIPAPSQCEVVAPTPPTPRTGGDEGTDGAEGTGGADGTADAADGAGERSDGGEGVPGGVRVHALVAEAAGSGVRRHNAPISALAAVSGLPSAHAISDELAVSVDLEARLVLWNLRTRRALCSWEAASPLYCCLLRAPTTPSPAVRILGGSAAAGARGVLVRAAGSDGSVHCWRVQPPYPPQVSSPPKVAAAPSAAAGALPTSTGLSSAGVTRPTDEGAAVPVDAVGTMGAAGAAGGGAPGGAPGGERCVYLQVGRPWSTDGCQSDDGAASDTAAPGSACVWAVHTLSESTLVCGLADGRILLYQLLSDGAAAAAAASLPTAAPPPPSKAGALHRASGAPLWGSSGPLGESAAAVLTTPPVVEIDGHAVARHVATLYGHTAAVHGLAHVSRCAQGRPLLISVSADGSVRVWDVAAHRCVATLLAHPTKVLCCCCSAAAAATDGGGASTNAGSRGEVVEGPSAYHPVDVFSADAAANVLRWAVPTDAATPVAAACHSPQARAEAVHAGEVYAITLIGRYLASGGADGKVRLLQPHSLRAAIIADAGDDASPPAVHRASVFALATLEASAHRAPHAPSLASADALGEVVLWFVDYEGRLLPSGRLGGAAGSICALVGLGPGTIHAAGSAGQMLWWDGLAGRAAPLLTELLPPAPAAGAPPDPILPAAAACAALGSGVLALAAGRGAWSSHLFAASTDGTVTCYAARANTIDVVAAPTHSNNGAREEARASIAPAADGPPPPPPPPPPDDALSAIRAHEGCVWSLAARDEAAISAVFSGGADGVVRVWEVSGGDGAGRGGAGCDGAGENSAGCDGAGENSAGHHGAGLSGGARHGVAYHLVGELRCDGATSSGANGASGIAPPPRAPDSTATAAADAAAAASAAASATSASATSTLTPSPAPVVFALLVVPPALTGGGVTVLAGLSDGAVQVWHRPPSANATLSEGSADEAVSGGAGAWRCVQRYALHAESVLCLAMAGRHVVSGSADCSLRALHIPVPTEDATGDGDGDGGGEPSGAAAPASGLGDGEGAAGRGDGGRDGGRDCDRCVLLVSVAHAEGAHDAEVHALVADPRCDRMLSASADQTVRVWTLPGLVPLYSLCSSALSADPTRPWPLAHGGAVYALALVPPTAPDADERTTPPPPTPTRLFSASADRLIKAWDLDTMDQIATLRGHCSFVCALRAAGGYLFSASSDKTLAMWCLRTYQRLRVLHGHSGGLYSLVVHRGCVISGSLDRTLRVWRRPGVEQLQDHLDDLPRDACADHGDEV